MKTIEMVIEVIEEWIVLIWEWFPEVVCALADHVRMVMEIVVGGTTMARRMGPQAVTITNLVTLIGATMMVVQDVQ